jgi:putative ABC transport system permease protein
MIQTALSLVLLSSAGLLARSFASACFEDLGYETAGILTFNISLPAAAYPPDDRVRFFERLERELSEIPGVAGAGAIFGRPLGGNQVSAGTKFLDRAPVPEGQNPVLLQRVVTPGYFETMGIGIVRGRGFMESDRLDAPRVAMISERLVDIYYPDADPLGRQLSLGFSWGYPEDEPRTIIGVVADHRSQHLTIEPSPEVFIPQSQFGPERCRSSWARSRRRRRSSRRSKIESRGWTPSSP